MSSKKANRKSSKKPSSKNITPPASVAVSSASRTAKQGDDPGTPRVGEEGVAYLEKVKQKVVEVGGDGRFQRDDYLMREIGPELANLLSSEPVAFGPATEVLKDAEPSRCHINSMRYMAENGGQIWSGFSLNSGVWRVHSWVVKQGAVIETTPVQREKYVGVPIDSEEKLRLWWPALGAVVDAVERQQDAPAQHHGDLRTKEPS